MSLDTADLIEIQQLYARYNTAIDTGDGETFGRCFVASGHLDSGIAKFDGREALAGFAVQTHESLPGMRHNTTNVLIDGDASGSARGSAFLIGYLTDGGYKVIVTGRYADELSKIDGEWRFTNRVFTADS
jgi:hypothetical protein